MEQSAGNVLAAGAILWKRGDDEELLIALVHRPRYDDWSLPKGKLEQGESHIAAAFREVLEETGVTAIFGPQLGELAYEVEGVTKVVRYWSAQASQAPYLQPNPLEVDALEWLSIEQARTRLTREGELSILNYFMEIGTDTTPLVLLRHAKAIQRLEWQGDDGDRPLDSYGQRQSARMLSNYFPYQIMEIHSSDAIRCLETVEPLARSLKLNIMISEELGEYRYSRDSKAALIYVRDVLEEGVPAIICSHNPILPNLMRKFIGKKNFKSLSWTLNPGESWVLHHREGDIVAVDWLAGPEV